VAPEIETEVFPDCGHDLSIVQTERFNRRVARFLTPDDELKTPE
jgi:pimeloyl-ACP methyl ester carboxylesterase